MDIYSARPPLMLRPVRPDDAPALRSACYPHRTIGELDRLLASSIAQADSGRGIRLVAEWDGSVIGCGELASWRQGAEIADLVVTPSHRNRGIGRSLIKRLLEEARSLGYPAVEIGAEADNQLALALYRKTGFVFRRTTDVVWDQRRWALVYLSQEI